MATAGPDRAQDPDPPAAGYCYYTPLAGAGRRLDRRPRLRLRRLRRSDRPPRPHAWRDAATIGRPRAGSSCAGDGPRRPPRPGWSARQGSPPCRAGRSRGDRRLRGPRRVRRQGSWTLNLPAHEPRGIERARAPPSRSPERIPLPLAGPLAHHAPIAWSSWTDGALVSPRAGATATTSHPGPHPEVTVSYTPEDGPGFRAGAGRWHAHRASRGRRSLPWSWSPTRGRFPSRPTTARSSPDFPPRQDGASFPIRTPTNLARWRRPRLPRPDRGTGFLPARSASATPRPGPPGPECRAVRETGARVGPRRFEARVHVRSTELP